MPSSNLSRNKQLTRRFYEAEMPYLVDYASRRFRKLCLAAGFGDEDRRVVGVLRDILWSLQDVRLGEPSAWVSEISDDNTPIEFSLALDDRGAAEVRVLFEARGAEPTVPAYRAAALALNVRLRREFGASLARFYKIEDLFLPEDMRGPFALWHSAVFSPGKAPAFKAYLNPQAFGPEHASEVVAEALRRLGLGSAWAPLRDHVLARGERLDELKYFALDLSDGDHARVKVYVRHHQATAADLEHAASGAAGHRPGETLEFVRAMCDGDVQMKVRAPFTCSSFVGETSNRPAATTVYVPVCAYARDDETVWHRVRTYLADGGADPSAYDGIIQGYANRPLDAGVGMQSWIALRRHEGRARMTVYLATEAGRVFPPGTVPAPTTEPK